LIALILAAAKNWHPIIVPLWVIMVFAVAHLIWEWCKWFVTWIVMTDRRLFRTSGPIVPHMEVMPKGRVTDITFEWPIMGRIFRYGHVTVESAGQEQGLHTINYLPNLNCRNPNSNYYHFVRFSRK
jgi:membrane protein YdbS with pleckstrin-like domain